MGKRQQHAEGSRPKRRMRLDISRLQPEDDDQEASPTTTTTALKQNSNKLKEEEGM